MCTVAFLPNNGNYCFASLRDESPKRPLAVLPIIYQAANTSFLAPKDPLAGGTWVGINAFGNVIILLNGGFENHTRQKKYRKSRGLIVTELLDTAMPVFDWGVMNFQDIEPFTLIIFSLGNLFQLVWDGTNKHRIKLDANKPYIWSSATLYTTEAKTKREAYFNNWMALQHNISNLSVLNFLQSVNDDTNGFIINRSDKMRTLSYTFLELNKDDAAIFNYYDLINQTYTTKKLALQQSLQV